VTICHRNRLFNPRAGAQELAVVGHYVTGVSALEINVTFCWVYPITPGKRASGQTLNHFSSCIDVHIFLGRFSRQLRRNEIITYFLRFLVIDFLMAFRAAD
jgi:hypothetical protein